jgi:hypothetical protein
MMTVMIRYQNMNVQKEPKEVGCCICVYDLSVFGREFERVWA